MSVSLSLSSLDTDESVVKHPLNMLELAQTLESQINTLQTKCEDLRKHIKIIEEPIFIIHCPKRFDCRTYPRDVWVDVYKPIHKVEFNKELESKLILISFEEDGMNKYKPEYAYLTYPLFRIVSVVNDDENDAEFVRLNIIEDDNHRLESLTDGGIHRTNHIQFVDLEQNKQNIYKYTKFGWQRYDDHEIKRLEMDSTVLSTFNTMSNIIQMLLITPHPLYNLAEKRFNEEKEK